MSDFSMEPNFDGPLRDAARQSKIANGLLGLSEIAASCVLNVAAVWTLAWAAWRLLGFR